MRKIFIILVLSLFFLFSCNYEKESEKNNSQNPAVLKYIEDKYDEELWKTRDASRISTLKYLESKIEMYYSDNGEYPQELDDIPDDPLNWKNIDWCEFVWYKYEVSPGEKYFLDNQWFRLSVCLENERDLINIYSLETNFNELAFAKEIEVNDSNDKIFWEIKSDWYYKQLNNVIYYCTENERYELECILTTENYKSFEKISDNYAKDYIFMYNKSSKIYWIDREDYKIVNDYRIEDDSIIYLDGREYSKDSLDLDTLIYMWDWYIKDKKYVYYNGQIKEKIDTNLFKSLWYWFFKDKNNLYFNSYVIDWIIPDNISILDWNYFVYNDNLYYRSNKSTIWIGNIINWSDKNTFKIMNELYARDKNNIYYKWKVLTDIDKNTFELIDKYYAKDNKKIYYNWKVVSNEFKKDNSFLLYKKYRKLDYWYIIIDNYIYYNWEFLTFGGDSFEILGPNYWIWENITFYRDSRFIVENNYNFMVDKGSFEVLWNGISKDINNVYYKNLKLNLIDYDSFEVIWNWFSKDKYNIYQNWKKRDDLDMNTFVIINKHKYKDKNNCYIMGSISDCNRL